MRSLLHKERGLMLKIRGMILALTLQAYRSLGWKKLRQLSIDTPKYLIYFLQEIGFLLRVRADMRSVCTWCSSPEISLHRVLCATVIEGQVGIVSLCSHNWGFLSRALSILNFKISYYLLSAHFQITSNMPIANQAHIFTCLSNIVP